MRIVKSNLLFISFLDQNFITSDRNSSLVQEFRLKNDVGFTSNHSSEIWKIDC
jgi:hypothetical protein